MATQPRFRVGAAMLGISQGLGLGQLVQMLRKALLFSCACQLPTGGNEGAHRRSDLIGLTFQPGFRLDQGSAPQ